jgi:hypothetical protein
LPEKNWKYNPRLWVILGKHPSLRRSVDHRDDFSGGHDVADDTSINEPIFNKKTE